MKKEEIKNSDSWKSPADDDNSPDEDYNEYVEDEPLENSKEEEDFQKDVSSKTKTQKLNERFDDAILNSDLIKKLDKPKRKTFKELWEEVDEFCPTCGKVSKPAEGLNRQNMKRLLSFQTDIQSLTILFLLLMCGLFGFSTYTYMTSPVNCSNFTVLDADIPEVYDYGDHSIIYPDEISVDNTIVNLSEIVYINPESIPTSMDNMRAYEDSNITINVTE